MPRTYFTSDLHFGHKRIIELCNRPFSSVEHMDLALVDRWNEVVTSYDKVYILGDLAMGTIKESMRFVEKLNGTKFLVPGNHDRVFAGYPQKAAKGEEMLKLYEDSGLIILNHEVDFVPRGYQPGDLAWHLSHFPTSGDHTEEDRYPEYRPKVSDGQWLIHGHVHDLWVMKGKQINVGVDVWDYYPVPMGAIQGMIDNVEWFEKMSTEEIKAHFSNP